MTRYPEFNCPTCEARTEFMVYTFDRERWIECTVCGYTLDMDDGPDPDDQRDLRMDREADADYWRDERPIEPF